LTQKDGNNTAYTLEIAIATVTKYSPEHPPQNQERIAWKETTNTTKQK
jgi:hypothetical protein